MPIKKRILIVEDDEAIRHGTQLRLDCMGYSVTTAVDGADGFDQAKLHHPDLIMMDIRMPKMDGLEALRKLKADPTTTNIPVVMSSASPGDQWNAIDSGAKFFLRKPYTNEALLATVDCSVREHALPLSCEPQDETHAHSDD